VCAAPKGENPQAANHSLGLDELVAARVARVPLQHLVGSTGFRYLDLAVGPGVFVPRPETELLVDAVLSAICDVPEAVVVDLCAGSGAIGLSVAHEHSSAIVHLVERSSTAFEWLERNAADRDRVQLHRADLAEAPTGLDGLVDVVVANPPYVPLDERDLVDPEVREYDPAEERHERLAPEVLTAAGFIDVSDHPDLTSRPRFSVGSLPC
jgi:release factor glutamine methyltransferase